jgi:histidinol dehydrogenase
MLRIITQPAEAQTELQRIRHSLRKISTNPAIEDVVRTILATVQQRGNQALLDYAQQFNSQILTPQQLKVSGSDLDAAYQQISKELLNAIQQACAHIEAFHRHRVPKSWVQFEENDLVIGRRYHPVERAGLYVEGGNTPHLSLILLQAIPARVAKVSEIVMMTPSGVDGKIHPAILVAAQEAGVTEIYRLGGATAIAALAYGTETIPKVDLITGLGNQEVTIAKKMVHDTVAIDSLAEASELVIISDHESEPLAIASDLLAQAERTPLAAGILLTTDPLLAEKVQLEVKQQLPTHPQRILTEKAIAHYGLIVVVDSLAEAVKLANFFAPQHLQLALAEPWEILEQIHHAGAIFLGTATPAMIGNYLGGSSSFLVNAATARYASALGVETFMKHSNLIQYSPVALKKISNSLQILAHAEGLFSSIDSIILRTSQQKNSDK